MTYLAAFAVHLHISPVGSEEMSVRELVALTRVIDKLAERRD